MHGPLGFAVQGLLSQDGQWGRSPLNGFEDSQRCWSWGMMVGQSPRLSREGVVGVSQGVVI